MAGGEFEQVACTCTALDKIGSVDPDRVMQASQMWRQVGTDAQSVANEDGSYTYVISPVDPGVANWIDSDGLREAILTLRMAEFGAGGPREDLGACGRVVKLDRLDAEVPHLPRVSEQQRATELAQRRRAYLRRLPEGTI